ncbi:BAG family molecular chaperone regulator 2 isoform X2 [Tachypleus tridentatus]|uniref:BAG family molecular chaperone regulator 2 isoform X2 n=1 Tax=Tachypleus tridentatus TaxID=6853 RepID=UPI003FD3799D
MCIIRFCSNCISHESVRNVASPERSFSNMAADNKNVERMGGMSKNISSFSFEASERPENVSRLNDRLVGMLDHIEKRVELLREHATAMEQEREALLTMISTVKTNKDLQLISEGEREEIQVTAERLLGRALTVEVNVKTLRNEAQNKALDKVNKYIEDLFDKIRIDLSSGRRMCEAYLNACLPEPRGPIDQRFQTVTIECTADDQKKTRRRLESLLSSVIEAEESLHH